MRFSDFNALVKARLDDCMSILTNKGTSYNDTVNDERLHSFKAAGRMKNVDPVEALDGMWLKHRVAIADCVERMAKDPSYVPTEKWVKDKLGDNINYTLLLEGLIEDRRRKLAIDAKPAGPSSIGEA